MSDANDADDELQDAGNGNWCDEESPFARDINGWLIRIDPVTEADYLKSVTLTIDGEQVPIVKAVPTLNAVGEPIYRDGRTIPRASTIYDAACKIKGGVQSECNIPILCHQPHQRPAAVCRICSVLVTRPTDKRPPRKLVPACQHRVEDGMVVYTLASQDKDGNRDENGDKVYKVVSTLVQLLVTDHLPTTASVNSDLAKLAQWFRDLPSRFDGADPRMGRFKFDALPLLKPVCRDQATVDNTSPVITVDHSACILCDRCVRGCNEVRGNFVIGRTGKGASTRIGFDLGQPMGESSCVECGECMISCPTDALTINAAVRQDPREPAGKDQETAVPVSVDELLRPPLDALFGKLPRKLLEWNAGAVYRRNLQPKDRLIHEGQYGSHAFLLEEGALIGQVVAPSKHLETAPHERAFSRMLGKSALSALSRAEGQADDSCRQRSMRTEMGFSVAADNRVATVLAKRARPNLRLIGESACLNNYPYGSTVVAVKPSVVLEIRRNLVLHLMRSPTVRAAIAATLKDDALQSYALLRPLLAALGLTPRDGAGARTGLTDQESRVLAARLVNDDDIEFVHVAPGQPIYIEGDAVDNCCQVRVGFVRVARTQDRNAEIVLDYVGPGGVIGTNEFLDGLAGRTRRRSYTYQALDHVELVRVSGQALGKLVDDPRVREVLKQAAEERRRRVEESDIEGTRRLEDFLDQGLYDARSLLVLDLDKCTRCDECTKACADTHNGVTRLIREGLRFERFLVTTSCRSCLDPTCLAGCPVDAIHRTGNTRDIKIEDWCIGCGLCANNCPYGNIHMAPIPEDQCDAPERPDFKATTCDLCTKLSPTGDPSCVYACPHDAAHRMNGHKLFHLARHEPLNRPLVPPVTNIHPKQGPPTP